MENTIPCRKAFTDKLLELAKDDENIIALASDSRGSVTLDEFSKILPAQFVEIGIAEQNAVGVAAGMALSGEKSFCLWSGLFLFIPKFRTAKSRCCIYQNKCKGHWSKRRGKLWCSG